MDPRFYAEYDRLEDTHWWFIGRRRILERLILDKIERGRGFRVLDVGCGTGSSLRFFERFGSTVGLDCEPQALDYCRRRGLKSLILGSADSLPLRSESFDLITVLDVLEHLDEPSAALAELRRICSKTGHVILTVPALSFYGATGMKSHIIDGDTRGTSSKRSLENQAFPLIK
jgi:ubiquinone/menaquinone biosynthesis C-methylase UbiE